MNFHTRILEMALSSPLRPPIIRRRPGDSRNAEIRFAGATQNCFLVNTDRQASRLDANDPTRLVHHLRTQLKGGRYEFGICTGEN
jgi:hypothetical protein